MSRPSSPSGSRAGPRVSAQAFFPEFSLEDLVSLAQGHIYLDLLIDGAMSGGNTVTLVTTA